MWFDCSLRGIGLLLGLLPHLLLFENQYHQNASSWYFRVSDDRGCMLKSISTDYFKLNYLITYRSMNFNFPNPVHANLIRWGSAFCIIFSTISVYPKYTCLSAVYSSSSPSFIFSLSLNIYTSFSFLSCLLLVFCYLYCLFYLRYIFWFRICYCSSGDHWWLLFMRAVYLLVTIIIPHSLSFMFLISPFMFDYLFLLLISVFVIYVISCISLSYVIP